MAEIHPKVRAVAFDLEGPLIDLEHLHHGGHVLASEDVGLDLTIEECLVRIPHFIGGPDEKIAEEMAKLVGADPGFILKRSRFHYQRLLDGAEIVLRPGADNFILWLLERGYKISIGSAVDPEKGKMLVSRSGLSRFFPTDLIIFAGDVVNTKPAPDVYLETARRMGVDPSEQLVFEDSPRGVKAGVAAGSPVIGMPIYWKPHTVAELIEAGARRIFRDWREINREEVISARNL